MGWTLAGPQGRGFLCAVFTVAQLPDPSGLPLPLHFNPRGGAGSDGAGQAGREELPVSALLSPALLSPAASSPSGPLSEGALLLMAV